MSLRRESYAVTKSGQASCLVCTKCRTYVSYSQGGRALALFTQRHGDCFHLIVGERIDPKRKGLCVGDVDLYTYLAGTQGYLAEFNDLEILTLEGQDRG